MPHELTANPSDLLYSFESSVSLLSTTAVVVTLLSQFDRKQTVDHSPSASITMAPTARKSIVDSTDFGLLPQVDPQNLSLPDLERGPVKELVSISGRGDAEEVERIWRNLTRLPGGEYWLNNPSSLTNALLAAIKGRRMENIRLLLQKGIPPNWQHAEAANTLKDTSILELLLQHGWDINETPSWYQPPLLA